MGDIETIIGPVTFANRDGFIFSLEQVLVSNE